MSKKLIFFVLVAVVLFGSVLLSSLGVIDAPTLFEVNVSGSWFLPLVGVAALIDSINPCAFGVLLLTIAFLLSTNQARSGVLVVGGTYILGLFTVYMLIGLGILEVLSVFNAPHFMTKVGAFFLVALGGINLVNDLFPSFPIKLRIPQSLHHILAKLMEKASFPAAFFLGILVGLFEFPCTGGPYLMVLGFLHDQGTYLTGFGYLLFYNLIFVLPLVVVLFIASDEGVTSKVRTWKKGNTRWVRVWGGIAMVILGVVMFSL